MSTPSSADARAVRVLVPVTYGFSVRYLLPTGLLDRLAEVCHPVIALGWDDADLVALLESRGFEVVPLPEARLEHSYRMFRRQLAIVHERRLASPTSRIQREQRREVAARGRSALITRVRRWRDLAVALRPGGAAAIEAREDAEVQAGTNAADFDAVLVATGAQAVLSITPYHDQDALLLWAARRRGIPSLTSIISFDNPTTRERMLVRSERIVVWNRYNADEVLRSYPDLTPDRVGVIGAPQFDLHHRADLVHDEAAWRADLGLPADRPIVLYGAGPSSLVPGEMGLVRLLDAAIDDGRLADRPFLLVRRHPNDPPEPWQQLGTELRHGVVAEPWAAGSNQFRGWPTEADLAAQMSSLAHSAVHVNVCSSMTVDGAVFDRPQVGPTFVPGADERQTERLASFYRQEHWLPIAASGGIDTAADEASLVAAVADALADPGRRSAGRTRLVEAILTFDDGRSSERLAAEVAALVAPLAAQSTSAS